MKKIAVVGHKAFENYIFTNTNKFQVSKVLIDDNESEDAVRHKYPSAELVYDVKELVEDATIKMVIVSQHKVQHAGSLLKAGKCVRVI